MPRQRTVHTYCFHKVNESTNVLEILKELRAQPPPFDIDTISAQVAADLKMPFTTWTDKVAVAGTTATKVIGLIKDLGPKKTQDNNGVLMETIKKLQEDMKTMIENQSAHRRPPAPEHPAERFKQALLRGAKREQQEVVEEYEPDVTERRQQKKDKGPGPRLPVRSQAMADKEQS